LKLMKENNKSNLHYIAYLTDRVMVNRSKEERSDYHCGDNQVYYTQWRYLNENDETAFYIPNIDWVKVFKKRQSIHLPHAFPGDVFSQLLSQHPKLKQFLEKENQL
ncbi:MAG: hypothetical protein JXR30_04060, partial [Alphaproteobacteria bacterium]|nr:hypothetical protein [Alphaproteobacteria bacterium]